MFPTLSRDVTVPQPLAKDPMPRGCSLSQVLPRHSSSVLDPLCFLLGLKTDTSGEGRQRCAPSPDLGKDDLELAESLSHPVTWQEPHHCPGPSLFCCAVSQGRGGVRRSLKPVCPACWELHPVLSAGAGVGCAPSWQLSWACKSALGSWRA